MILETLKAWEDSQEWAEQKEKRGKVCEKCGVVFGPELFAHMPVSVRNTDTGEVETVCLGKIGPHS